MTLRPELTPPPARIAALPVDKRGYPVPWFVAWENGEPEFRAMDRAKWTFAVRHRRCWVCGQRLGVHLSFTIGPMCAINRTNSEPPSHHDCATWSAINCPFLSRPQMVRREDAVINNDTFTESAAGFSLTRNPGVACVWTARTYTVFRANVGGNGYLIEMGEPERVEWYAEGRIATRPEVVAAIDAGLPFLRAMALRDDDPVEAAAELTRSCVRLGPLLPVDNITEDTP